MDERLRIIISWSAGFTLAFVFLMAACTVQRTLRLAFCILAWFAVLGQSWWLVMVLALGTTSGVGRSGFATICIAVAITVVWTPFTQEARHTSAP